jgi:DNA-binding XRE family transcriptional regulator
VTRSKSIPVQEVFKEWENDPAFRAAEYDSLEDEFTLATALIKARDAAHMTQEDVAKAMGTSQEAIARLESGKSQPSTRTLHRSARATGMRLRISFEPENQRRRHNAAAADLDPKFPLRRHPAN